MKSESKAAAKQRALWGVSLFFLLLAGCAETPWPTWISGEPGAEVLQAPRAVKRAENTQGKPWPALGDAPSEKPVFSKTNEMEEEADVLHSDRLKAEAAKERIESLSMPEPLFPETRQNQPATD